MGMIAVQEVEGEDTFLLMYYDLVFTRYLCLDDYLPICKQISSIAASKCPNYLLILCFCLSFTRFSFLCRFSFGILQSQLHLPKYLQPILPFIRCHVDNILDIIATQHCNAGRVNAGIWVTAWSKIE